jgi:hypothetical protein
VSNREQLELPFGIEGETKMGRRAGSSNLNDILMNNKGVVHMTRTELLSFFLDILGAIHLKQFSENDIDLAMLGFGLALIDAQKGEGKSSCNVSGETSNDN